jgi:5-methylcytosine-specific restriction endonuclease McrA
MLTKAEVQEKLSGRIVVFDVFPLNQLSRTRLRRIQMESLDDCKCVACGLNGALIVKSKNVGEIHKHPGELGCHNDVYGILPDGNLRMLTLDHILPYSKGGANRTSNYQVMCAVCNNNIKGSRMSPEDWARILKHPELYVGASKPAKTAFAKALYRDTGISLIDMLRRQQDVLAATGQLWMKPNWNKLFPSSLMETGNAS